MDIVQNQLERNRIGDFQISLREILPESRFDPWGADTVQIKTKAVSRSSRSHFPLIFLPSESEEYERRGNRFRFRIRDALHFRTGHQSDAQMFSYGRPGIVDVPVEVDITDRERVKIIIRNVRFCHVLSVSPS